MRRRVSLGASESWVYPDRWRECAPRGVRLLGVDICASSNNTCVLVNMRPDESSSKYTLLSVAVKPRNIPLVFFLSSLAHLSEPGFRAKTREPKTRSLLTLA